MPEPTITESNRRARIASMYLRGMPQYKIAEKLGISQPTVSRVLSKLQQEWERNAAEDTHSRKARELEKLDQLEKTYWEAWQRSRGPQFKNKKKDAQPDPDMREPCTWKRDGNPAFLQGVERCQEKRAKLLGMLEEGVAANPKGELPTDEALAALAAGGGLRVDPEEEGPDVDPGVHEVLQPQLPGQLAPRTDVPGAGRIGFRSGEPPDAVPPATLREKRTGLTPLAGLFHGH